MIFCSIIIQSSDMPSDIKVPGLYIYIVLTWHQDLGSHVVGQNSASFTYFLGPCEGLPGNIPVREV